MTLRPDVAAPFAVRRLVAADLPAYKRLRDLSLAMHPDAFSSDAAEALRQDAESYRSRLGLDRPEGGHFTLGAWQADTLIAAVSCDRETRVKVRHIGHLTGMMVRGDCAGRGVGRALLDAAIEAARRADGLEMLTLSVTASNLAAVRLYERAGFVRYGSLPNAIKVDGRGFVKNQMVLTLSSPSPRQTQA